MAGTILLGKRSRPRDALLLAVNPTATVARELRLIRLESSVGSGESNDVRIRDDTVSRRHALIRQHGRRWQVIDSGSANGTYVGKRKAVDWINLRDGEEVRFGGVRFVFRSGRASGARATRDFIVKPRASGVRALTVLIVVAVVGGFAASQYYLYRWYQARADHAHAVPSVQSSPASAAVAEAPSPPAATHEPTWLERVNHWRERAGLPAVSNDPKLDEAAKAHARYLVKHVLEGKENELDSGGAHTEDPSDSWYTPAGLTVAQNSDVDPPCRNCMLVSASEHVDGLVAVPFHRVRILDPAVTKIGFGSYTEAALRAAVLYMPVPPDAGNTFSSPIEFPPDGSKVGLAAYQSGEWPDPLTSCPGYTAPTGLPITLELGRWLVADVSDYSFKVNDQALPSCIFTAATYNNPDDGTQTLARDVLKGWGTVVMIPRQLLTSGQTYTVSITANGNTYSWSFSVS
jgi:uncharacterized protein YkwD